MTKTPTKRFLSLGAGVQSTTIALLAAEGALPKLDAAIFSDTGWEPKAVYRHLDRLEREVLQPAGIPLYRVRGGNLRKDVLDPNRMRTIPAYTATPWYEVKVIDEWKLCSDPDCGWRKLRQVKDDDTATAALFEVAPEDVGDMGGLFDSVVMVPERASLEDLDNLARAEEEKAAAALAARRDAEDDDVDEDDDEGVNYAAQVAKALRRAGLDRLPERHAACRSMGRVVARWHTERRRDIGMMRRRCTQLYKLNPILAKVRHLLGAKEQEPRPCRYCLGTGERVAPWRAKLGDYTTGPCSVCDGEGVTSRVGQPPAGLWAEQWIGFSTDEVGRVSSRGDTRYSKGWHPLLELGMSRTQCETYLQHRGWTAVTKSACVGCPLRGNAEWRRMRDHDPESWADAVAFDREYRTGPGMRKERFLHISRVPLDEAPIDKVRPVEWSATTVGDQLFDAQLEEGDPDGCSPWGCRSGEAVA